MLQVRQVNLQILNSITKYPEIKTYHVIGEKGILKEERNVIFQDDVIATEKVDGTNGRIIVLPDGYFIGSREELLYASGDLLHNPAEGIVQALRPVAEEIQRRIAVKLSENPMMETDLLVVFYLEVYGGKLPANKKYTNSRKFGARLFDYFCMDKETYAPLFDINKPEWFDGWRNHNGQPFATEDELKRIAEQCGLDLVPRLPISTPMPVNILDGLMFLKQFGGGKSSEGRDFFATRVALDGEPGKAEGVVVRSSDRKIIAKIRFEDYERTLHIKRTEK